MGIKHTQNILRKDAIYRIRLITYFIEDMRYEDLRHCSYEVDYSIQKFIDKGSYFDTLNIDKWTNDMLEEVMDMPFYRYSRLENYLIPGGA